MYLLNIVARWPVDWSAIYCGFILSRLLLEMAGLACQLSTVTTQTIFRSFTYKIHYFPKVIEVMFTHPGA